MQRYKHGNGKQHHLQPQPRDNKHRDRYRAPQNNYGKRLAFLLGYSTVCHIILNINAQFRMFKQPVAPTRISFQEQPGSEQKKRCCRQHGHKYADSPQYHARKSGNTNNLSILNCKEDQSTGERGFGTRENRSQQTTAPHSRQREHQSRQHQPIPPHTYHHEYSGIFEE